MKYKSFLVSMAVFTLIITTIFGGYMFIFSNKNNPPPKIKFENFETTKKCPPGFIIVPGNEDFGIKEFCVMKYVAKCTNTDPKCVTSEGVYKNNLKGCECQNSYSITSTPDGAPITFIPENDSTEVSAKSYCKASGWHLLTNPEWMTIARNVEQVESNWCDKDGTNCNNPPGAANKILANGHNDSSPNKALTSGEDNDPCFGTSLGNENNCGQKGSQKRTLTLSNGQIIWDLAGNVWQWVDELIPRNKEPRSLTPSIGGKGWVWAEFQTVPYDVNLYPTNQKWSSTQGVGRIFHYNSVGDEDETLYTYIKGGNWRHGYDSGVYTVHMQPVPGKTNIDDIGFRCAASPTNQ